MTKWLDVKEYPLPISKKYDAQFRQGFESNKEDILVFVADPQGDFMRVTTLYYMIEDTATFNLSDKIDSSWVPLTSYPCHVENSWIDRITHWMPLSPPKNKDDNYV